MTQFVHAEHFRPWNSLPDNAGVSLWCGEIASCRDRVKVQKLVGIHHNDCTFQPGRSRTWEHSASGGTGFGKPTRQFEFYPLLWSDLWKLYPTLSMYNWDTAECVHGEYQDVWRKFTKIDVRRRSFASFVTERSSRQVPWIHGDIVGQFAQNELQCNEHSDLHWQPENVKCGSMLKGCGICMLCYSTHQQCIHALRCNGIWTYAILGIT